MSAYKICLVGGFCGSRRFTVAEQINELFTQAGIHFKTSFQNAWENSTPPHAFDLVLQIIPVFTEAEISCPMIIVKFLLVDPNHQPTIKKIMQYIDNIDPVFVRERYAGDNSNDLSARMPIKRLGTRELPGAS